MPNYSYPEGYLDLTPEQKAEICNGCGGKGLPDIIPDCLLGADCEEPCNIHDYGYWAGLDKRREDRRFLFNLAEACDTDNPVLYAARINLCIGYFKGVSALGGFFREDHQDGR